jgi:hypothetical protein
LHVEPGHALAQVAHYIHLNPVRANVVTADKILAYRWSSLRWFAAGAPPRCLESRTIRAECGGLSDTVAGWQNYAAYLAVLIEKDAQKPAERVGQLSRGWAIGSDDFRAELVRDLATKSIVREKFALLGADRAAVEHARAALWEESLQRGAQALGVALERLPPQKSAAAKVQLAALMKMTTSVSNGWLASRLQMGVPGAITHYVRQFRQRGDDQSSAFKAARLRI